MFIRSNADRILLQTFMGLVQVGAHAMVFKFATLIGVFLVEPFQKIWNVKSFEIANEIGGPKTIARVFTLFITFLLFFGLVLSVEIPVLLRILTPKEFWLGGSIAALAVFSRIASAAYYQLNFGILYAKKTYKLSVIQWVVAGVYLLLSLLLIKPFGILGAVIVSCITNCFECVMGYKLSTPYYKIPFEWEKIILLLSMNIIIFILLNSFSVNSFPSIHNWINGTLSLPLEKTMTFFHLNEIKEGKLLSYSINNLPIIFEGIVKALLCLLFLPCLFIFNIFPRTILFRIIKSRSLKPIFNE